MLNYAYLVAPQVQMEMTAVGNAEKVENSGGIVVLPSHSGDDSDKDCNMMSDKGNFVLIHQPP